MGLEPMTTTSPSLHAACPSLYSSSLSLLPVLPRTGVGPYVGLRRNMECVFVYVGLCSVVAGSHI